MEIDGRVALVTGAGAGAGRGIAHALAARGAIVAVADLDVEAGLATVTAIEAAGGRAGFVRADMTVPADVAGMVAYAGRLAGAGPHVLVNNAGGGGHVPPHFPDAEPAQWGATLDLNLRGPMLAAQLCLEPMRRAGGGAVVNVASSSGLGLGGHPSPEYAAAKAGLIRFTATLAGLAGVRVNCVVPDWILTERAQADIARMTPAELPPAPVPIPVAEVAAGVLELIADDALAGRVMVIDPGVPRRLL
jgi:NAD(P)-dependent dehydrogenase (short-subunit alcohol dehydrogenase family)